MMQLLPTGAGKCKNCERELGLFDTMGYAQVGFCSIACFLLYLDKGLNELNSKLDKLEAELKTMEKKRK